MASCLSRKARAGLKSVEVPGAKDGDCYDERREAASQREGGIGFLKDGEECKKYKPTQDRRSRFK
nr:hypothetical protein [Armatimonas sp.]